MACLPFQVLYWNTRNTGDKEPVIITSLDQNHTPNNVSTTSLRLKKNVFPKIVKKTKQLKIQKRAKAPIIINWFVGWLISGLFG